MDQRNSICTEDGDFSRTGANHIGLVLLLKPLGPFEILIVGEDSNEDAVEFGKTCKERTWDLYVVSERCRYIRPATKRTLRRRWKKTRWSRMLVIKVPKYTAAVVAMN